MTTGELVAIVLSSSVLASVVTVVLGGIVNRALKKLDYTDDYYKTVLRRRIEAYEFVESQIALLKSSVMGQDGRPYHLIFAYGQQGFHEVMAGLAEVMRRGLWLSDTVQRTLTEVNHELLDISFRKEDDNHLITLGQERYERFAGLRHQLEQAFISDIKTMHKVEEFLSKKQESEHKFIPFAVATRSKANRVTGGF